MKSQVQWLVGVEWLGNPVQLTLKYKAILVTWSKAHYGPVFTPKYGDWSGDSSNTWDCFRDGQTLSAFSKWWNNKTGANLDLGTVPTSGECKNVLTATLTPPHQNALDAFVQPVEVVTQPASGGVPSAVVPGAVADCNVQCQGLTGAGLLACKLNCLKWAEAAKAGETPMTCPAGQVIVNGKCAIPAAATTPPAEKKTPWGWIIGGAVVLGGLAWWAMRSGGSFANNPGTYANPRTLPAVPDVNLNKFWLAYVDAALWSSTDESDESGGEPLDKNYSRTDITKAALQKMRRDADSFALDHADLIRGEEERAGHDFWLTRNGHGSGFWDGDWPEPAATILTKASEAYGEQHLYVHRKKIHVM